MLGGGSNTHPRQGATWPYAGNKYANFGLAAVDAHPGTDDEAGQTSNRVQTLTPKKKKQNKRMETCYRGWVPNTLINFCRNNLVVECS